ncbi:hypothetical protein CAFE_33420 [Caprobacter fermentans]|uniref:Lipoprotein n=1 Tax=Caproicibacter fermentans TaxID=2576756 RepID=A0A6N8I374_9FIRM|nr:hypothetical protein [Caproicibacter fermentans]MVB12601.1 hypothetical protein [Caproicibacter fermentans]
MKKFFTGVILTFVLLLVCAVNSQFTTARSESISSMPHSKTVQYSQEKLDRTGTLPQTLKKIEDESTCIVKGILQDDAKQKLQYFEVQQTGQKVPYMGITVSSLKITEVYRGNFTKGEIIPLAENYFTVDEGQSKTVRYDGNYLPSETGKEYLFFLADETKKKEWYGGNYTPVDNELGRYPVVTRNLMRAPSVDSMSNEELNLGKDDAANYKNIYKEVIAKYMR